MTKGSVSPALLYGGLIFAEVAFGVWPIVARLALNDGLSPLVFILYRCVGASAVLLCILLCQGESISLPKKALGFFTRDTLPSETWTVIVEFTILGILFSGNVLGYIIGVATVGSTITAILQPTIPVLTCFFSVLIGSESVQWIKLLGISISVGAAMSVVTFAPPAQDETARRTWSVGILALMVNVFSGSLYYTLTKIALSSYGVVYLTTCSYIMGSVCVGVLSVCYVPVFVDSTWKPWTLMVWSSLGLVYAVLLTSTINYLIINWANRATNPSTVTAFNCLQPPIAAAFGYMVLGGEQLSRTLSIGGVAIVAGLMLTTYGQSLQEKANPETDDESERLQLKSSKC